MEAEKTALITYGGEKGIDVNYTGLWTRRDVERVHYAMIKALPAHILEQRQKLEKEKEDARKKRRAKRQRKTGTK